MLQEQTHRMEPEKPREAGFCYARPAKDKNGSPIFTYQVVLEGVEGGVEGLFKKGKPAGGF